MSDIVSPLLEWLNAHPHLAGLLTFVISAGESVAIIGTIVPGSIMMTALGTLAGAGVIPLWSTIIYAILGAIVGDGISYWFGRYFKDRLPSIWPFRNYPNFLVSGEVFFHKYGGMSVFMGRFVGPVRALVPLVAGMLGMRPLIFYIANISSAILWAPAYMLPGIMLGAASLELPPEIAIHVMVALLLIILFILLCLWFIYKILKLIHHQTNQLQNKIWHQLQTSKFLYPLTRLLKHHDPHQTHGQLSLALLFVLTTLAFIVLVTYVKLIGPANIEINNVLFHLFRGIRSPIIDQYMINITLLGQKQVLLPAVAVTVLYLLVAMRWRVAIHALALGSLAAASVFIIKHLLQSPRPWGIAMSTESFSMPSGHATLSTTVFIGLAFLLVNAINSKKSWTNYFIYIVAVSLCFIIGLSRLYLGAHWFTDVLAGWLLSASVLLLIIISYQRKKERPLNASMIALLSLGTIIISYAYFYSYYSSNLKNQYKLIDWPYVEINAAYWWQHNKTLPAYHVSLFGLPSEAINIEWAGQIDQIRATLIKNGWQKPPARDFISTLHRISNISSTQFLPLVSPQYLDKKPELILTKKLATEDGLLVLRLWDSHRLFIHDRTPLWVGFVAKVPGTYNWLFRGQKQIAHRAELIFQKPQDSIWIWRELDVTHAYKKHSVSHKVLLIRLKKGNP